MVYSNTSDINGIIQRCEDYTGIGNTGISGDSVTLKKFTSHVNEALYDIVVEIMRSQDSYDWDDSNNSDYPVGTFSLVAGQRDYVFPSSLNFLSLKRVDITYDGTNWYRATPIDSGSIPVGLGNADNEDSYFSKTSPRYDPKSNGFWVYPRPGASDNASARIEFTREFDEFVSTDTTQEPGIDRQFHDLLAIGASLKWAVAKLDKRAPSLKTLYDEGIDRLKSHYGRKNKDHQLFLNPQLPSFS